MCGRFSQRAPYRYAHLLGVDEPQPAFEDIPREVRPTDEALVCALGRDGARHLRPLRWGLVPAWSQGPDPRYSMINARAETVAEKPAYREPFRSCRCVVPAEAFFEWKAMGGRRKQPYAIRRGDGEPLAFAGLWDHWRGPEGAAISSFTIIVTDANALLAPIHDRMPVILPPAAFDAWLDPSTDPAALRGLLRPCPPDELEAVEVDGRDLLGLASGPAPTPAP